MTLVAYPPCCTMGCKHAYNHTGIGDGSSACEGPLTCLAHASQWHLTANRIYVSPPHIQVTRW